MTCFGPRLRVESLTYVDEIAGGGKRETIETTVLNCGALEEKKKAFVNLEKSKWMKIGKGGITERQDKTRQDHLISINRYLQRPEYTVGQAIEHINRNL